MASAALDRMMEERIPPSNPESSERQVKLDGVVYVGDIRRHISAENKAKKLREENRALMSRLGQNLDETPTWAHQAEKTGHQKIYSI
jgi:uncharacterized membrane protein